MIVDFGRDVTGRLATAESKEWLCANGIGGFASGRVAGHRDLERFVLDGTTTVWTWSCAQAGSVAEVLSAWQEIPSARAS